MGRRGRRSSRHSGWGSALGYSFKESKSAQSTDYDYCDYGADSLYSDYSRSKSSVVPDGGGAKAPSSVVESAVTPDGEGAKEPSSAVDSSATPDEEGRKASSSNVAFAAIPKILDEAIERHDKNAAIRSTTIQTANFGWIRNRQKNLLLSAENEDLLEDQIASEKNRAFDLLDALS